MPFTSSQVTVNATTSVQLVDAGADDTEAWISVATGSRGDAVYLGGANTVTPANGFRLEVDDDYFKATLTEGDEIWARGSGTFDVHVLVRSTSGA